MGTRLSLLISTLALLLFGLMPAAIAQIGIQVELNRSNYHEYESIYAKVHLQNFSGHPLAFGDANNLKGKLSFEIENASGGFMEKLGVDLPSLDGTIINRGEIKTITVPVSQHYNLSKPGKYTMRAIVEHALFQSKYQSNAAGFSIITGTLLWERIVGVPNFIKKDPNEKIKPRKYRIESMFDGKDKVFYMIIEDEKTVYSVKRIGFEINNSVPLCEIDSLSRIHILAQAGAKIFSYMRYDIDGKLEEKEVYFKTDTSPTLVRNTDDGTIIIAGGRKARKDVEYQDVEDKKY